MTRPSSAGARLPKGSFAWVERDEDWMCVYQITEGPLSFAPDVVVGIWHDGSLTGKAYFSPENMPPGEARQLAEALIAEHAALAPKGTTP